MSLVLRRAVLHRVIGERAVLLRVIGGKAMLGDETMEAIRSRDDDPAGYTYNVDVVGGLFVWGGDFGNGWHICLSLWR